MCGKCMGKMGKSTSITKNQIYQIDLQKQYKKSIM